MKLNKHTTDPIRHQKMLLAYHNIKIDSNAYQRACEAIDNLQKTILKMKGVVK